MMRIPRLVAAILALRQTSPLLPDTYCTPQCPSCKVAIANFNTDVSCVANSSFITNCGSCQQCIITYAIEEGATSTTDQLNKAMINILNLCENTTVSTQVEALQSQASKLSVIGEWLASASSGDAASRSMVITSAPATTATGRPSTAHNGADGDNTAAFTGTYNADAASSTATPAPSNLNQTLIFLTPTSTRIPSSTPFPTSAAATTTTTSLSSVWIAGPVMGSILGMSTVFLVIFFTRRKQRAQLRGQPLPSALSSPTSKEFPHSDSAPSNRSSSNPTPPPEVRVSAPPGELECSEIHELPAREPVGSELNTPRDVLQQDGEGEEVVREEWPMPLSPLPLLFAMSELRDKQAKVNNDSPKHETFYHP